MTFVCLLGKGAFPPPSVPHLLSPKLTSLIKRVTCFCDAFRSRGRKCKQPSVAKIAVGDGKVPTCKSVATSGDFSQQLLRQTSQSRPFHIAVTIRFILSISPFEARTTLAFLDI